MVAQSKRRRAAPGSGAGSTTSVGAPGSVADTGAGEGGAVGVVRSRARRPEVPIAAPERGLGVEIEDVAAPLDSLLVDAAFSPLRRFNPGMSGIRLAARLASRPRNVGRRAAGVAGTIHIPRKCRRLDAIVRRNQPSAIYEVSLKPDVAASSGTASLNIIAGPCARSTDDLTRSVDAHLVGQPSSCATGVATSESVGAACQLNSRRPPGRSTKGP